MKRSLFPLLVAAALGLAACTTSDSGGGDVVHDEPIPHDLLTAGERVEIRADVEGDAIAAGSQVIIAGPIAGYAIAAGRHVDLRERVGNDFIAAGETVDIRASVDDRVLAAGRTVRVHPDVEIGTAYLAGNTVSVEGEVREFLKIGAQEARIAGRIGGPVEVSAARVILLPGAMIDGDLIVESPTPPEISPQAAVSGSVDHRVPETADGGGWGWIAGWFLYSCALLVLGLVTVALSPAWAGRVEATLAGRPGASLGIGALGLIIVPIVAVLLFVTVIGIPLGMLLSALYVAALLLAAVFVAYRIGTWLLGRMNRPDARPYLRMIVGAVVLALAISLPWIGGLVGLAAIVLGLGALLLERREARGLRRELAA